VSFGASEAGVRSGKGSCTDAPGDMAGGEEKRASVGPEARGGGRDSDWPSDRAVSGTVEAVTI
jgi:hypothetical protein